MTRDDLFAIAKAAGWTPGTPLTPAQKLAIRNALVTQLPQAVAAAPRVFDDGSGRLMSVRDAVQALFEEIT